VTLLFGLVALAALALLAVAVRDRRERAAQLRELAAELQRERERGAPLPALEERTRIARELHDVVAHSLRTIAGQASAAEAVLDAEPERVHRPLRVIRRSAQEALGEMQRLLGAVGGEETPPGLAQLPELVERARAAGMPVTLHVDGEPRPVPAGLDLSAYRIVQEALANVHKHARGAPATVHVAWNRSELSLQVRDVGVKDRPAAVNGDGRGLPAIRERVGLLGGELHAGRLPGGGYEVRAVFPL
jgi:signal transduction histidine kinase